MHARVRSSKMYEVVYTKLKSWRLGVRASAGVAQQGWDPNKAGIAIDSSAGPTAMRGWLCEVISVMNTNQGGLVWCVERKRGMRRRRQRR